MLIGRIKISNSNFETLPSLKSCFQSWFYHDFMTPNHDFLWTYFCLVLSCSLFIMSESEIICKLASKYGVKIPLRRGNPQSDGWSHIQMCHISPTTGRDRSKFHPDTDVKQIMSVILMSGRFVSNSPRALKLIHTFEKPIGRSWGTETTRAVLILGLSPLKIMTCFPVGALAPNRPPVPLITPIERQLVNWLHFYSFHITLYPTALFRANN